MCLHAIVTGRGRQRPELVGSDPHVCDNSMPWSRATPVERLA